MTANGSLGFILLDSEMEPIVFNSSALQILAYPAQSELITQPADFLKDKIRARILHPNGNGALVSEKEYRSGVRRYQCRIFQIEDTPVEDGESKTVILLERPLPFKKSLSDTLQPFDLTPRELQTVMLIAEGLTSKEIASRMHVSTNTVKAFLRLVMVKMNVSTRSGIVGKIVGQGR